MVKTATTIEGVKEEKTQTVRWYEITKTKQETNLTIQLKKINENTLAKDGKLK